MRMNFGTVNFDICGKYSEIMSRTSPVKSKNVVEDSFSIVNLTIVSLLHKTN